jgi:hypothetical protein
VPPTAIGSAPTRRASTSRPNAIFCPSTELGKVPESRKKPPRFSGAEPRSARAHSPYRWPAQLVECSAPIATTDERASAAGSLARPVERPNEASTNRPRLGKPSESSVSIR